MSIFDKCRKPTATKYAVIILAALCLLLVVLFTVKAIKRQQKIDLINSGVVYYTKGGKRYHLYASCSNMVDPKESTEKKAASTTRTRCKTCYSGVFNVEAKLTKEQVTMELSEGLEWLHATYTFYPEQDAFAIYWSVEGNVESLKKHVYDEPIGDAKNAYEMSVGLCRVNSFNAKAKYDKYGFNEVDAFCFVLDTDGKVLIEFCNGEMIELE